MLTQWFAAFVGIVMSIGTVFSPGIPVAVSSLPEMPIRAGESREANPAGMDQKESLGTSDAMQVTVKTNPAARIESPDTETPVLAPDAGESGRTLSYTDLLQVAGNEYADGEVPLGDSRYTTSAPKRGYVYLCNIHKENPGSMTDGSWMHETTWNYLQKSAVKGTVSWPQATFSATVSAPLRSLIGNGLPVDHTTGIFPVAQTDLAYAIDANPNSISEQSISQQLPAHPVYSDTPYCMGGEVGIMLSGVPLFNAFDAGLRDAPAHELQDSCDGHPQGSGEYHYHGMSACVSDQSVATVLGFAYDGFPITGNKVADKKYLTTNDLDECHGITSEVMLDGVKTITYHYVMTRDFPYSTSCFRGKPVTTGPSAVPRAEAGRESGPQGSGTSAPQAPAGPPSEALNACFGSDPGETCSFDAGRGEETGTCEAPPGKKLACRPVR